MASNEMTTSKDPHYVSYYTLCVIERLHHLTYVFCYCCQQEAIKPDRAARGMGSYSVYIGEIKDGDEAYFIVAHNLPYCIALFCCFVNN